MGKAHLGPSVNLLIARRFGPAPGDPTFFSTQTVTESVVVQASFSTKRNPDEFLATQSDRVREAGVCYYKVFSAASLALRLMNLTFLLPKCTHVVWGMATMVVSSFRDHLRDHLAELVSDSPEATDQITRTGLDTVDFIARVMASYFALRKHTWLQFTLFSGDVQASLMMCLLTTEHAYLRKRTSWSLRDSR